MKHSANKSANQKKLFRINRLLQRRIVLAFAASLGIAFFSKAAPGWQSNPMTLSATTQPGDAQLFSDLASDSDPGLAERWLDNRRRAMLAKHLANRPWADSEAEPVPVLNFTVPDKFHAKIVRKVKLPNDAKVMALTFDDGPWPKTTGQIVDILEKYQVDATFFWVGQHLRNHSELARQVAIAGHAIGNHTWHHRYEQVDRTTAANEIQNTEVWINRIAGSRTELFRPPGGHLDNGLASYAQEKGYTVVMWSIDPHDTKPNISANAIAEHVLAKAHPGGIILLHDGGRNRDETVKALPAIIKGLRAKGYRLVTVPALLEMAATQSVTTAANPDVSN